MPDEKPDVKPPPKTWKKHILWLGPSFLWMVSAAGSGELLFTPRIAAQYGYVLLWALLAAVILKLFVNHEIGRYAVATGAPVLRGFGTLPGRWPWAVWLIVLPQLVVAPALNAGMAGAAASAVILVAPGSLEIWATVLLVATGALVLWGKYGGVEKIATFLGLALAVAIPIAALRVGPDWGALGSGLVPSFPGDVRLGEILPWLGFMMAGAAGLMWYSYWVAEKGYGAASIHDADEPPVNARELSDENRQRIRGWIGQLTLDNIVAVVGVVLPTIGFLILGAELLRPQGLLPAEDDVGRVIGQLLGDVWGRWGFWFMIATLFVGFGGTLLSQHDGFARLFSDGISVIARSHGLQGRWRDREFLQSAVIIGLTTLIPIALFWWRGNPVQLLQLAGAIEAAHIVVVAILILYLNQKQLPDDLRPTRFWFFGAVIAALFFAAFAILFFLDLLGLGGWLG